MGKFIYTAKNTDGNMVKGEVDSPDKKSALDTLRNKGILILKLDEAKGKSLSNRDSKTSTKIKVPMEELVIFTRQMATMTTAGITIVNTIDTLSDQVDNKGFKSVLRDIREAVKTGASLSEGMSKHTGVFFPYYVNMIRAGESSGMLDSVLERVAVYLEKSSSLQKKIQSAMVYPAVVTSMALIITLVMILKVIPVFEDMFSGFGAALPAPTQFLINLSNIMRNKFWLMSGVIIGSIFTLKWYIGTDNGKIVIDGLKLKMPVFGPLLRKVAISKFTRTLSTLVKSGVPILSALEIVGKTSGNVVIERAVNDVKNSVQEGESISAPMCKSGLFPPLVTRMIEVGEKSGELENMLTKIADFYDEQVDTAVDGMTSLIEPLIIAFLGIVIGGIVICMFLPIFQMSSLIQM